MKRILFLFLPLLPYLASAQVAKDTVTVLTIADIPAGAIRDTTNLTFVQDNGFKKATFDSLAKYTRVKLIGDRGDITVSGSTGLTWELDAGVVDSMQLSAGAVVLPGAKVTGTLPVSKGGTGRTTAPAGYLLLGDGTRVDTSINLFFDTLNTRLGLGINNPATTLDIRNATGNAIIRVSGAAGDDNGASLRFTTPGGTGTFFSFGDRGSLFGGATGQTASLFTTANVPFTFDVGQSQRAVITANGLFGINQAIPDERLHVNGRIKAASTNSTNLIVDGTNTNGWGTNMALRSENANFAYIGSVGSLLGNTTKDLTLWSTSGNGARIYTNGSNLRLIVESGGDVGIGTNDPVYRLDVNGNFRADSIFTDIAGNAVFSTSDARLKKNIEPVPSMLQKITALNPVTYEWNDLKIDQAINRDNTAHLYGKKIGLIAQEVYEVFPDFVGTDADGNMVLSYGAFIVPMLKAIQEQQAQIEQLKQRITQLENK